MSVEQAVRRKQAFERALKDYLEFVSVMGEDEIELTLGRLADLLNASEHDAEALHFSIKGAALKIYLDLRRAGLKNQRKVQRMTLRPAMNRFFRERGQAEHARAMKEWEVALVEHKHVISQWKQQVRSLPLLQRIAVHSRRPAAPKWPAQEEEFIKDAKERASMTEYLIHTAANFDLLSIPQRPEHVQHEDVKRLAP